MDYKEFKYRALKNNTFNLEAVEKSLEESKMNSYQYLRNFQLDSTGYKRFDFNMQDIYRSCKINHKNSYIPRRWLFFIEHDFIHVSKRIAYKRSELYEKELSYDDVISHPDIFDSSYLVFVNGKLYTKGVKILCKEDKTYLIITCKEKPSNDGFTIQEMRDYIQNNVKVTIIFLPNVGIRNIQTNGYRLMKSNKYDGLPLRTLNLSEQAVYDDKVLSYARFKDDIVSTPTTVEFGPKGLYVDQDTVQYSIDNNPKDTSLTIQVIPLRYLFDKIVTGNMNKWFELPLQSYPISVENCLVFDVDGNFLHDAKVKHYYPNIYSIENVDDIIDTTEVHVYVFYYDVKQSVLKHIDMLSTYHKYMTDYFERYKNNTIHPIARDFDPEVVDYSIKNFMNHESYDKHFRYKIMKMREFIKADVNNFRRYLTNLGLRNNYYYVDVSKIDLESRKRINNEDVGLSAVKPFNEEMYVFVFRNDFRAMYEKLLIHVDGTRYDRLIDIYGNDKYDFVYIPARLVNSDSVIEVEKLTPVMKEFEFVGSENVTVIDIGEFAVRNKTLFNDLFLTDKESSEYIDPEDYEFIYPFEAELENITEKTKVDYILSDSKYYQLDGIDENMVHIVQHDDVGPDALADEIITNDELSEEEDKYLLNINIDEEDVNFSEYLGENPLVKYLQSQDDPNVEYCFRIRGNKVTIDVISRNPISTIQLETEDKVNSNLDEVFLPCPRKVRIKIINPKYQGKELILHIKKNVKLKEIEIGNEPENLEPIYFSADMKNDKRYVRLYRNGRLIPRHLGGVRFPKGFEFGDMELYPGTVRKENDVFMIELMPYKMHQICYLERIPDNKVIDLTGMIDKPFDFKWHDIYLNGKKLVRKEVEILSANRIKILKSNSLRWLEIIENSRDKEYFGTVPVIDILDKLFDFDKEFADIVDSTVKDLYDREDPVVDPPISIVDYILKRFYKDYLVPTYGLINPDLLQLDEETIDYYEEILSKDTPFLINSDIGRVNGTIIHLPVNPDDE